MKVECYYCKKKVNNIVLFNTVQSAVGKNGKKVYSLPRTYSYGICNQHLKSAQTELINSMASKAKVSRKQRSNLMATFFIFIVFSAALFYFSFMFHENRRNDLMWLFILLGTLFGSLSIYSLISSMINKAGYYQRIINSIRKFSNTQFLNYTIAAFSRELLPDTCQIGIFHNKALKNMPKGTIMSPQNLKFLDTKFYDILGENLYFRFWEPKMTPKLFTHPTNFVLRLVATSEDYAIFKRLASMH